MSGANLRAVIRIKTMAKAAAVRDGSKITADEGEELVAPYERLREEAKALNDQAGWDDDHSFKREMSLTRAELTAARRVGVSTARADLI